MTVGPIGGDRFGHPSVAEVIERVGATERSDQPLRNRQNDPSLDGLARIAEAFNTSLDYLVFDNQPRRPLDAPTNLLEARVPEAAELPEDDLELVTRFIDALLAKNRVRNALR